MRKALGLLGDAPRHRPDADRADPAARTGERFNGGLHRRRFVQDGDVPVTVLRREPGHEVVPHRSSNSIPPPTSSRLQRTEAALAAETAAREKAERMLSDTLSIVRDLQTKIGHAELAKNDAVEALRQEREAVSVIRAGHEEHVARLQQTEDRLQAAESAAQGYQEQLAEERLARRAAERALRAAESDRDAAQLLVRTMASQAEPARPAAPAKAVVPVKPVVAAKPVAPATPRTGQAVPPQPVAWAKSLTKPVVSVAATVRKTEAKAEPEPVKWWLSPKPAAKQR